LKRSSPNAQPPLVAVLRPSTKASSSAVRNSARYASIAYRQKLADRDITISMSRPGNPFDNAKLKAS